MLWSRLISDRPTRQNHCEFTQYLEQKFRAQFAGGDIKRESNHKILNLTTDQLVTYLDGFHGADHQHGLQDAGAEPTQQASGAVQAAGLVPDVVAEELKHPEPEERRLKKDVIVDSGII